MSRYDRPVWPIVHCGKLSGQVTDWEKEIRTMSTTLTEAEAASEYAKYFYQGPAGPSQENRMAAERGRQLELEEVFMPEDFLKVMTSGRVESVRSGYRQLADGTAYAVVRTRGEGVTDEMVQFFIDHFRPEGDLFYKIWCPGFHMRHYMDMAVEDVGCGMEGIQFKAAFGPAELGFTDDILAPSCITVNGGNGVAYPLHRMYEMPRPAFSIRYTREIPDGRESILFYWQGIHYISGKGVRVIPDDMQIPEADIRSQVTHCGYEQATEYQVIRQFWEDQRR